MRDWPVLCQETSGSKTLMCGLEAFSKVNNIQPGDECIFGVEDVEDKGDHFRFGSVFIKKNNQTEIIFFKKKNRNRTETGSNRPVSVRFFRAKTGSNRFWLGFFRFDSVFSVLARFFRFGSVFFRFFVGFGSVRFFRFFGYKTEPNRPVF